MKIHEYQAKEILRRHGIATPRGEVTDQPSEAKRICEELGGRCVVKAQIHAGGRGKGGGVKLAGSPEEAETLAGQILGMQLVTHQTGPEGQEVKKVYIEEASEIARELYVSVTLDREKGTPLLMASTEGGMDIETVAAETPEKILKEWIHPQLGLLPFQARRLAAGLESPRRHRPRPGASCSVSSSSATWTATPPWSRSTRWWSPATARSRRSTPS